MKILFLESFYGGSHEDFARDFQTMSNHHITLLTLAARHWKWRQAGSALAFIDLMKKNNLHFKDFDGLIITGLTDLNLLKSLFTLPPVLLYFHETQFHYPLALGETVDFHYGFKDFTNMLAADRIIFNSYYHGETFFHEANNFLKRMPDGKPEQWLNKIKEKWDVVYPGYREFKKEIRFNAIGYETPIILWNHRWEHDKNPQAFYNFLKGLQNRGIPFQIILLGERFKKYPAPFDRIREDFFTSIIIDDYAESKKDYEALLYRAHFVVSTALQENFGISIVEAIRAGCLPLLPDRLSYREILGEDFHDFLYSSESDMIDLFQNLSQFPPDKERREKLINSIKRFNRNEQIKKLDRLLKKMISGNI